jgi:hypothetical protein
MGSVFEYLKPFRVVIVTGPARSGTTICGHMIAADTGKRYLDDTTDTGSIGLLRRAVAAESNAVAHCPLLSWYADEFGCLEDVAVVMVRRDVTEIRASNDRLAPHRLDYWRDGYHALYWQRGKHVSEAIYQHWDSVQAARIQHAYTVDYTALTEHPLWVPAEQRRAAARWGVKTWRLAA